MKTYIGSRGFNNLCTVSVLDGQVDGSGAAIRILEKRLDLYNHSPTGFEWGYGGSGPAQLALALLADATGNERDAIRLHQRFKFDVIAKLPRASWELTGAEIGKWYARNLGGRP